MTTVLYLASFDISLPPCPLAVVTSVGDVVALFICFLMSALAGVSYTICARNQTSATVPIIGLIVSSSLFLMSLVIAYAIIGPL
jgi:hypothetical protein